MLHIVHCAWFERAALHTLLARTGEGDTLLLIEDAVCMTVRGSVAAEALAAGLPRLTVCALEPDLAARGIAAAEIMEGVVVIDDGGFVDLAAAHPRIHTWS